MKPTKYLVLKLYDSWQRAFVWAVTLGPEVCSTHDKWSNAFDTAFERATDGAA